MSEGGSVEEWQRELAELAALFRELLSAKGYDKPARRVRRKQVALKLGLSYRQAIAEHPDSEEAITLALMRACGLDEVDADAKPASWRRF